MPKKSTSSIVAHCFAFDKFLPQVPATHIMYVFIAFSYDYQTAINIGLFCNIQYTSYLQTILPFTDFDTVLSGYNDCGYNDFREIQHTFLGPGRFPISAIHSTPDITTSYITTFRDIRHVLLSPDGCFSFIFTPFITTLFLRSFHKT